MSYTPTSPPVVGRAEREFREAFERLKRGKHERLAKGTPLTQNNVAKEAGRDPSALKKDRYPTLVRDIQRWIEDNGRGAQPSPRQTILANRRRNRGLKEKIETLKAERDTALSILVEADARILDLTMEVMRLQSQLASNVTQLRRDDAAARAPKREK